MKTCYDSMKAYRYFEKNDIDWMHIRERRRCPSWGIKQNCKGPNTIVKKSNNFVYRVQRSPNVKPKVIHINRPFHTGQLIIVVCDETVWSLVFEEVSRVKNMKCRFPEMLVLW
ncbi:hypothetical protein AVEN_73701-1 [Araneus ventricosus]|uniref:Uncharacterized protein n=1 Tax=Araneus ventricosus TaxID=182803 RepID=A0A4Y2HQN1_ARAVE|nr:hypothetical protein AVEN_73701-1 [Araneus ventricosus]